jgi:hypothetical protein
MSKLKIAGAEPVSSIEIKMANVTLSEGRPQFDKKPGEETEVATGKFWQAVAVSGARFTMLFDDQIEETVTVDEVVFRGEYRGKSGHEALKPVGILRIVHGGKVVYPTDGLKK